MKLRNKLVAVLAASMVVTSVPVVTMADSSNTLSVYNYKIKDSSIGFTTTDYNYDATNLRTTGKAYFTEGATYGTVLGGAFNYAASGLPKLEITPEYNYALDKTQSNFLHLTTDSEFIKAAYVLYTDALYSTTGKSSGYVDADGKFQGSSSDYGKSNFDGVKVDDIINNCAIRFQFIKSGTYAQPAALPTTLSGTKTVIDELAIARTNPTRVTLRPTEITETTFNDRKYKQSLRMDYNGTFEKGITYPIPFLAKVGGSKEVLAYLDGNDSFVSSKTFSLTGVLTDKKLVATSDSKTITVDNIEEIGEIRLDESQIGALADAEHRWIKLEIPSNMDLEFNLSKTKAKLVAEGKRGFLNQKLENEKGAGIEVRYGKDTRTRYNTSTTADDNQRVLLIELPRMTDPSAYGQLVLKGIYVEPKDKTAATGDLKITLSEDLTHGNGNLSSNTNKSTNLVASTELKVATIADYGVTIETTPVKVKAGRSGVVNGTKATFTLKEAVKDSLVDSRKIEFKLENGYFFGPADVYYNTSSPVKDSHGNIIGYNYANSYSSSSYAQAAKARFLDYVKDETIKFEEKAERKWKADGTLEQGFDENTLSLDIDANGYVTGFSARYEGLKSDADDKIKVTIPVATPVMATGDIKLIAGNLFTRSYEKDVEAVVANITEPVKVEVENAAIKVGLQDQKAGKITIKETDKGMLSTGWIYLSAETLQDGITFDEVPEIKVTAGNMKIKNQQITRDKKAVAFEIERTSTEASTIEISNIKFTADRTVPEANYDLEIWGEGLTDENVLDVLTNVSTNVLNSNSYRNQYTDRYIVKDFITMTTKNTQDISESGLKAATASFVANEKKFTVNGETVNMDSAAYIDNGNIMVPVKYVAKAFGIEGNALQYDKATSTATITAGNKVISITANKAAMIVNGTPVPMTAKAVVKEGRMCVPMANLAAALGVEKSWDANTKTATFTNQAAK